MKQHGNVMLRTELIVGKQNWITGAEAAWGINLKTTEPKLYERTLEQVQSILAPARINSTEDQTFPDA